MGGCLPRSYYERDGTGFVGSYFVLLHKRHT